MRLYSTSLPKLALFINVVCLFTVLLLKSVYCISLYNKCSSQNIAVDYEGRVYSKDDHLENFQNLTIRSADFSGKLTIFAEESQRYLCFNKRWKLVGMTKFHGTNCQFYEEMSENGYTKFRSARSQVNDDKEFRYIGFNKRGKPMKETRKRKLKPSAIECLEFLKLGIDIIKIHNSKVVGHDADITSNLQTAKANSSSHGNSISYVYKVSNKAKIRHKNHHHQNNNDIT